MDLIDRYVHAVGQYLPHRLRADVEAELRSLLAESVQERARVAGTAATEDLALAVVRDFGSPKEAAARYAPEPQYLIGPRLFPVYVTTVKVMVPVLAALVVVLVVVGRFQEPGEPPSLAVLIRATGRFLWGALINLGIMTLVFALVERATRQSDSAGKAFDPASLPRVDDPDRVSYFGRIFALYAIAILVLAFNFFPEWVALFVFHGSESTVYPLLTPAFNRYLPLLNAWWILAFVLNLVVLRQGRWTRPTRWAELALEIGNALILLLIVTGPPVFRYDVLTKVVLQWFLVILAIQAAVAAYRLLKRRPAEPWVQT